MATSIVVSYDQYIKDHVSIKDTKKGKDDKKTSPKMICLGGCGKELTVAYLKSKGGKCSPCMTKSVAHGPCKRCGNDVKNEVLNEKGGYCGRCASIVVRVSDKKECSRCHKQRGTRSLPHDKEVCSYCLNSDRDKEMVKCNVCGVTRTYRTLHKNGGTCGGCTPKTKTETKEETSV